MAMKKLICFDFDGTLTDSTSWYLFNTHFGMTVEEDTSLFKSYINNSIDYKTWIVEIVKILKDRNLCDKESVESFAQTITAREEASEVIKACKDAGYITVVISGGLKQIVEPITKNLGIDHVVAISELVFNEDGKLETIIDNGDEMHAKVKVFETICAQYEVKPEETIVVGDGGNDLEIFKKTQKGIQIGNYEPLKPFAWKNIENLKEIIDLI